MKEMGKYVDCFSVMLFFIPMFFDLSRKMKYIGLESYYDIGADILFRVERLFYRYETAMKNDINDVVVALKVVDDPYRESIWKIDKNEEGNRIIFIDVTKQLKEWCGVDLIFTITGSCFVDFEEDSLVRIGINNFQYCCQEGIKVPKAVLHVTHNILG